MKKADELAQQAKQSIDKFVDTIKLKSNLASMEAKDAWEKVGQQLAMIQQDMQSFSSSIKQETDEGRLQAHLALMNAKQRWEALRDEVDHLVEAAGDNAEEKIDHARVQMALADLEARELIDKKKYGEQFGELTAEIKEDWYSFLSGLDERVIDFINKFPLR